MTRRLTIAWIIVGGFALAVVIAGAAIAVLLVGKVATALAIGSALGGYALGLSVAFVRFVSMMQEAGGAADARGGRP